eukprot:15272491-Ditylum_brightwellii.AAC.1
MSISCWALVNSSRLGETHSMSRGCMSDDCVEDEYESKTTAPSIDALGCAPPLAKSMIIIAELQKKRDDEKPRKTVDVAVGQNIIPSTVFF